MSREYKFRAWKKGFPWPMQVLSLEMEPEGSGRDGWALLLEHPCPRTAIIKRRFRKEKVKDIILMQSTGLKDKAGKEIFEGDVVKYYDSMGMWLESEIINPGSCFAVKTEENPIPLYEFVRSYEYDEKPIEELEIIGNIWENPDLLKT